MKPTELGAPPRYDHKILAESKGPLNLLASGNADDGVTVFRQDARLYLAQPARGESVDISAGAGRHL